MNRDKIRDRAKHLGLKTANFAYAETEEELILEANKIGTKAAVKPVMSSSGKGQSYANSEDELKVSWKFALEGMRGNRKRVIVEEFIDFEYEITLLTILEKSGKVTFCNPIGHFQKRGDYQYSWQPADCSQDVIRNAQNAAKKMVLDLGGSGIFGVEFFIDKKGEVIFSELSPRPHDTGMVTMFMQDLSQFALHARAILGLPIPVIRQFGHSASSVILVEGKSENVSFSNLDEALLIPDTQLRLFGKPMFNGQRRMGVALARADSIESAREKANQVVSKVLLSL